MQHNRQRSCTVTGLIKWRRLHNTLCLLREKWEETRSGFTLFQKFQIFATFSLFVFSFCPLILHFFRRWPCVVDIKTQELTTFVFILPVSVCHSPLPVVFHCALQSGIVHKFAPQVLVLGCQPTGSPEDYAPVWPEEGEGWNRDFVVKACLSISLKFVSF